MRFISFLKSHKLKVYYILFFRYFVIYEYRTTNVQKYFLYIKHKVNYSQWKWLLAQECDYDCINDTSDYGGPMNAKFAYSLKAITDK